MPSKSLTIQPSTPLPIPPNSVATLMQLDAERFEEELSARLGDWGRSSIERVVFQPNLILPQHLMVTERTGLAASMAARRNHGGCYKT